MKKREEIIADVKEKTDLLDGPAENNRPARAVTRKVPRIKASISLLFKGEGKGKDAGLKLKKKHSEFWLSNEQ